MWPGPRHLYWSRIEVVVCCVSCENTACQLGRRAYNEWGSIATALTEDRLCRAGHALSIKPYISTCAPGLLDYANLGEEPFPGGCASTPDHGMIQSFGTLGSEREQARDKRHSWGVLHQLPDFVLPPVKPPRKSKDTRSPCNLILRAESALVRRARALDAEVEIYER